MKNVIIKIDLDGERIGSKPLMGTDTLVIIRDRIKAKTDIPYVFLDQDEKEVEINDEQDYTLKDIEVNKIIKLKSIKEKGIPFFLNNKKNCTLDLEKQIKLDEVRNLLKSNIKEDYFFLDSDGKNIEKEDEKDYSIEDCLKEEKVTLKSINPNNDSKSSDSILVQNNYNKSIYTKKKVINLANNEILGRSDNLTIYKYSKIERTSPNELVYQYYYDKFDINDYKNSYVILFCGKTGDGKTTAINAFFNIVKGIELNDNYRFILIKEKKKEKGQAESQTDGVHLYYLRDNNNKPIIIIDSQGYGDTHGKSYDDKINDAFEYVFSHVIDHINTVCFIAKSNTNRLDILTRYIFSCVTSLFSEDISENFIILATYANEDTFINGPDFIDSIKNDNDFLNIQQRMDKNWWYAFDSKSILSNKDSNLAKFSYKNLLDFYKEKVFALKPKNIKKCAEILMIRKEYKIHVNNLTGIFENLIIEQENLEKKINRINIIDQDIQNLEVKINDLEINMNKSNPEKLENDLIILNEELNKKLKELQNEKDILNVKTLDNSEEFCTFCKKCEKNCHYPCDCRFSSLTRCRKYSIWFHTCEECGCLKTEHKQDYYKYCFKIIEVPKNTDKEQEQEKEKNEIKKKQLKEEINRKEDSKKSILEKRKLELKENKEMLKREKGKNMKEKETIQIKINNINKQIFYVIVKLQNFYQKINDIVMNNNFMKTEDEYIDSLSEQMEEIGYKDKEQINKLKQVKENNRIFKESLKLKQEELINLSDSQLAEKLSIIIPKRVHF